MRRAFRISWEPQLNSGLCVVCTSSLIGRRSDAKYCSRKCSRDGQPLGCATEGCTRPYRAQGLCNPCYKRARRAAGFVEASVWDDRRRDHYHRRRALKKLASTGEPVLLSEIRERDKGRCHLCSKRVPDKPWPHPMSPSLDHVVPLTKGGAHDPSNVKLAHLSCNTAKGNRGGGEQLMLIG